MKERHQLSHSHTVLAAASLYTLSSLNKILRTPTSQVACHFYSHEWVWIILHGLSKPTDTYALLSLCAGLRELMICYRTNLAFILWNSICWWASFSDICEGFLDWYPFSLLHSQPSAIPLSFLSFLSIHFYFNLILFHYAACYDSITRFTTEVAVSCLYFLHRRYVEWKQFIF